MILVRVIPEKVRARLFPLLFLCGDLQKFPPRNIYMSSKMTRDVVKSLDFPKNTSHAESIVHGQR